jgi:putative nucleotidyltransferase with HDIG domain
MPITERRWQNAFGFFKKVCGDAAQKDFGMINVPKNPMRIDDLTPADRYLDRITKLPPAPGVASELLGLFSDPNIDIDRVIDLIRRDPALTANVIKMCNSALFRGAEASDDIFEAVTRLGFYDVYQVVAALLGARAMAMWQTKGGLNINDLWQHSLASAIAAGKLAKRTDESEAVAYMAGLLHDIGKLVFASVEGARYADLVRAARKSGTSLREAERTAFGVDHALVGQQLLVRWGLPGSLTEAIGLHEDLPQIGQPCGRLTAIVMIASELAAHAGSGGSLVQIVPSLHPAVMELLGITDNDVPLLLAEIQEGLQQVAGISSVNFDPVI